VPLTIAIWLGLAINDGLVSMERRDAQNELKYRAEGAQPCSYDLKREGVRGVCPHARPISHAVCTAPRLLKIRM